uniref:Reverse transcriptase domain-containing protein n=1 Tax=Mycena chlorophos TaxID=658473 RepID=A0ABQ0LTF9_MYCCL|nr:predicted protein [Mycena chlorophos]
MTTSVDTSASSGTQSTAVVPFVASPLPAALFNVSNEEEASNPAVPASEEESEAAAGSSNARMTVADMAEKDDGKGDATDTEDTAPKPTATKKATRATRSVTGPTDAPVAASVKETYKKAGMQYPIKSSTNPAERVRANDTELKLITKVLGLEDNLAKAATELDKLSRSVNNRFADLVLTADSGSGPVNATEVDSMRHLLEKLNAEATENRARLGEVTEFLNKIAKVPTQLPSIMSTLERIQNTVKGIDAVQNNAPITVGNMNERTATLPLAKFATNGATNGSGGSPFLPSLNTSVGIDLDSDNRPNDWAHADARPAKRARHETVEDDDDIEFTAPKPANYDIYLSDVVPNAKDTPKLLGERAVKRCGMPAAALKSSQMLRHHNKVLSLRFSAAKYARQFLDIMTDKERVPAGMEKLKAQSPTSFSKNTENGCRTFLAWNIDGRLALKLADPEFVGLVTEGDIVFIQETFLREEEERTLDIPNGYEVVARARPDIPGADTVWGGVVVLVRRGIPYTVVNELSAPDIIVLDLIDMFFVGSYVLPAGSKWQEWSDVDPERRLVEALTFCAAAPRKPLLAMGDINARTGNTTPVNSPLRRLSTDDRDPDTRGRRFVRVCRDLSLVILNGTIKEANIPGALTSFQPQGATVIDYAICTHTLLDKLENGALVITRQKAWSDHAILSIEVASEEVPQVPRFPPAPPMEFPPDTDLDRMAYEAVRAGIDEESKLARLYGLVYDEGRPASVYIASAVTPRPSATRRAAAAAYWGPNSAKNTAACVPRTEKQDQARADHWSLYLAVTAADPTRTLVVYTGSEALMSTYAVAAPEQAADGWRMPHADVVEVVVQHIRARTAPLEFRYAPGGNTNARSASEEAHRALDPALADTWIDVDEFPSWPDAADEAEFSGRLPLAKDKVTYEPISKKRGRVYAIRIDLADVLDMEHNHRGRTRCDRGQRCVGLTCLTTAFRERMLFLGNLKRLLGCRSNREFWDLIRSWTDPRPVPQVLSPSAHHGSFQRRVNPPDVLPEYFNPVHYERVLEFVRSIPRRTMDRTIQRYFSEPCTEADIERVKARLRKKSPKSGKGIDAVTYAQIRSIPNDVLARLFNECLERCDAPQRWLVTILIGILKPGKPPGDTESYRMISLECCLLKVMTMVFDDRITQWAEDNNIFPDSQNGFRKGRRTDDGAFILAASIARARAQKKTLYILFGDMTNAFPYTDMPTLWTDLYTAGVSGPWFDFMRMIYARMMYATRNCPDESFASGIGLMTGDSPSPTLWNLFFADYEIKHQPGDVRLHGRVVCQVELADDNATTATSTSELQLHADDWVEWADRKRAYISIPKTEGMVMGDVPDEPPVVLIRGEPIKWVTKKKFQGIWFSNDTPNIFEHNYTENAAKARNAMNAIFALKHRIGSMPVDVGLQLYKARVDPYLTRAADISPDIDGNVKVLEEVQHEFLRRLLGVGPRSLLDPLFTETGLQRIRARRIDLALGRARYMSVIGEERSLRWALLDSLDLWALKPRPKPGWASNLANVLCALKPTPVLMYPADFLNKDRIDVIRAEVVRVTDAALQQTLDTSIKCQLLRGRTELAESGRLETVVRRKRHYLMLVLVPAHRKSLTRLLLSNHALSIETLRYGDRNFQRIPREARLCRLCLTAVEDEPHALLHCEADDALVELREAFRRDAIALDAGLFEAYQRGDAWHILRATLASRKAVARMARYVHDVFALYAAHPQYVAEGYRIR